MTQGRALSPPEPKGLSVQRHTYKYPKFCVRHCGSKTPARDAFRWSVYNRNLDRLFSVEFDNETTLISFILDDNKFYSTEQFFAPEHIYELRVAMNFASNLCSLLLFALIGKVDYAAGAVMGVGQLLGARFGSKMVMARGTNFIRPVFITVVVALTLKLIYDAYLKR